MELFRKITSWVSRHRRISALLIFLTLGAILGVREVTRRTSGSLTEPLRRSSTVEAVYGIGTVTADRSYSLKPAVALSIQELFVREGDTVGKGAKLATLDGITYRAPFDGVVNYLPFKVHENVFAQIPFLVLTDLTNRYLVVTLEQQGALRIRPGQKAKISFDSLREKTFEGKIESVYSYGGNFLARIDASKLPPEILPDMTADIAIVIREIAQALVVPTAAIQSNTVWVKRGRALPSPVRISLGVVDGAFAEVVSGDVREGDRLLIREPSKP